MILGEMIFAALFVLPDRLFTGMDMRPAVAHADALILLLALAQVPAVADG